VILQNDREVNREIIDTHCHLDSSQFDGDRTDVIKRALEAGVTRMITIGTGDGLAGAARAIALAESHPSIWATVGVHPHNATYDIDLAPLYDLATHPRVLAIGETGLDRFRDWAPVEAQARIFKEQIELALRVAKPIVIHSREAGLESLAILKESGAAAVGGVFHCFSESAEFAKELLDLNFLVSFPGQLTFKKAENVRDVCRNIPIEQIIIETDSPYLAPEPNRGKRCEPAFVVDTLRVLSKVKGLSLEDAARETSRNAIRLFWRG
jgi:TatD DNase family protein